MDYYGRVRAELMSLTASTVREIQTTTVKVNFYGLNSPYTSHKTVTLTKEGHCISNLVVVKNTKSWLGVSPTWITLKGDVVSLPLQANYVKDLFRFPAEAPEWLEDIVNVHVPNWFAGFSKDGEPEWKEKIIVNFEDAVVTVLNREGPFIKA